MKIFSKKKWVNQCKEQPFYKEEKISILSDIVNPWKSRILRNISNIFLENLET